MASWANSNHLFKHRTPSIGQPGGRVDVYASACPQCYRDGRLASTGPKGLSWACPAGHEWETGKKEARQHAAYLFVNTVQRQNALRGGQPS